MCTYALVLAQIHIMCACVNLKIGFKLFNFKCKSHDTAKGTQEENGAPT